MLVEFDFDAAQRRLHPFLGSHVVARWIDPQLVELIDYFAGDRIHLHDPFHFVAPVLDAVHGLLVAREYLECVPFHTELAANEVHLVPLVLNVHQATDRCVERELDALHQPQQLSFVLIRRSQAVDRRNRRHDDHVSSGQECRRGRVAKSIDLVVDRRLLLDEGVGLSDVRLGLVVVVVGDEVLDPILREELPELVGKLCRQRLVRSKDQRRLLHLLDRPCDSCRLSRSGDPEERLEAVTALDTFGQAGDCLRLIAGRIEV